MTMKVTDNQFGRLS